MELKRLVPRAVELELSEKLEKADIIRLTVDFLKTPDKYVEQGNIDYKEMGFRDCISEISRFFSGTDTLQLPVHQRMLAHLQYFTRNSEFSPQISSDMPIGKSDTEIKILQNRILFNIFWLNLVNSFSNDNIFDF